MAFASVVPAHWKRYKDIAWLLVKHGRSDLVKGMPLEGVDPLPPAPEATAKAEELARDLEELGPTFIKLGQVMSSRGDLLPPAYWRPSRASRTRRAVVVRGLGRIVESELGVRTRRPFSNSNRCRSPPRRSGRCTGHASAMAARGRQGPAARHPASGSRGPRGLEEIAKFFDEHTETAGRFSARPNVESFGASWPSSTIGWSSRTWSRSERP